MKTIIKNIGKASGILKEMEMMINVFTHQVMKGGYFHDINANWLKQNGSLKFDSLFHINALRVLSAYFHQQDIPKESFQFEVMKKNPLFKETNVSPLAQLVPLVLLSQSKIPVNLMSGNWLLQKILKEYLMK